MQDRTFIYKDIEFTVKNGRLSWYDKDDELTYETTQQFYCMDNIFNYIDNSIIWWGLE